ncbi:L-serine ammonia-lyase, iron-sulfur-dependent, subunit alpha [Candidatus Peregrinibacteria bacterium]|nr:L-serine ammonia-lyase, iron-sulfur-dependent, subunit alpha [Candidatus Peregrinibacteria bacterium]
MEYAFQNTEDVLKLTKKHRIPVSQVAICYEAEFSNMKVSAIRNKMKKRRDVMYAAVKRGIATSERSKMGMVGGDAHKLYQRIKHMKGMMASKVTLRAMAYALAANEQNACMSRIVAFPTAGGSGVLPGVLFSASEHMHSAKRKLLNGLFCAAAVGLIIAEGATLSAAEGGCQAEVGAAVAMAAAGLTEMRGGMPEQCFDAAAIALKSYLGLVCDPLGGLVEVPCTKRNGIGAAAAIAASDMAIAGIKSYIPFDEVVWAMKNIGQSMSSKLKETALGGLAMTPTGQKIKQKLIDGYKKSNGCESCGHHVSHKRRFS